MIAAAIDIGTNSVKLVVGERTPDGVKTLYDGTRVTRLGQGVDATGTLHPDAIARTLDALKELSEIARSHGATVFSAVGTSALRDASDGPDFSARASELLGGPVEIIRGEREAELTFAAITHDPDLNLFPPKPGGQGAELITSDIGGGSSEVVLGDASGILFETSLQLGAVRLTERVKPSDPWTPEDLARARELVEEAIGDLPAPLPPIMGESDVIFVACGGTAANLAGVALASRMVYPWVEEVVNADSIHGVRLTVYNVDFLIEKLAALPLTERKTVPGLEPARAEVIVAGAIIQQALLKRFSRSFFFVSARGLRFGLLYTLLKDETKI